VSPNVLNAGACAWLRTWSGLDRVPIEVKVQCGGTVQELLRRTTGQRGGELASGRALVGGVADPVDCVAVRAHFALRLAGKLLAALALAWFRSTTRAARSSWAFL
jgi:hypothetical protein